MSARRRFCEQLLDQLDALSMAWLQEIGETPNGGPDTADSQHKGDQTLEADAQPVSDQDRRTASFSLLVCPRCLFFRQTREFQSRSTPRFHMDPQLPCEDCGHSPLQPRVHVSVEDLNKLIWIHKQDLVCGTDVGSTGKDVGESS